jgi:rsbT co-antagonist protein RsbR
MSVSTTTLRALFGQIDAMAWAMDADGTITLSEGAHLAHAGFAPGQLVGQNLLQMYQHDPASLDHFNRALAGETLRNAGDVNGRFIESRVAPFRDEGGEIRGIVGVTIDLTDQHRDQLELAAQTAALREQADLLDHAHDAILVRRLGDSVITYWNHGAERMHGVTRDAAIGRPIHSVLRGELPAACATIEAELAERGYWEGELVYSRADGSELITASRWVLRRGEHGRPDAVLHIDSDITARRQAERAELARQQEIIRAQALAIEELSTPLIPITDEILVMPLIGMMDSARAKQVMTSLLDGLAASRGKFAILDITGVPVVDTAVANALLKAAHAARLLGTEVILTGIRPEVAQTLVAIDAKLGSITTRGTLQSGIKYALGTRRLGAA